ncbi:MAG: hypothetical protein KDJ76_08610 [Xanthobacteraceae bacterium]|nr:hypothetical protein [Xanthobacteraceae bacterium]
MEKLESIDQAIGQAHCMAKELNLSFLPYLLEMSKLELLREIGVDLDQKQATKGGQH